VVDLLSPPTSRSVQLEWPEEVGGVLEVGSNIHDLMNKILNTDNSKLAESSLDDVIGSDGSTVSVNLNVPTLVDELANRLQVGCSPGNVGLSCVLFLTQWPEGMWSDGKWLVLLSPNHRI